MIYFVVVGIFIFAVIIYLNRKGNEEHKRIGNKIGQYEIVTKEEYEKYTKGAPEGIYKSWEEYIKIVSNSELRNKNIEEDKIIKEAFKKWKNKLREKEKRNELDKDDKFIKELFDLMPDDDKWTSKKS